MTYAVGLTGNLASGKSTVAEAFARLGAHCLSADQISRQLCEVDQPAYQAIVAHFGQSICQEDKTLDRKKLRSIIFTDGEAKTWLEHLLHPLIRQAIEQEVKQVAEGYSLVEIPLLLRREDYPYLDRVLVVLSPEHLQIERVMARDHCDESQTRAILASQPDLKQRLALADDLIFNDQQLEHLQPQVERLHHQYLHAARESHLSGL